MKQFKILFVSCLCLFSGCNYLDIVPDDKPTLDDAFKSKYEAQKSLHGLYARIPDFFMFQGSPTFCGSDELITSKKGSTYWYPYKGILYEEYSVNNPTFNLWSDKSARTKVDLYSAVRSCYQFINKVPEVPGLEEDLKMVWIAEAEFLVAYYHFLLMQFYGPVMIVDKEYNINSTKEEMMTSRSPYDECVEFVVNLLDKANTKLPEKQINLADYGRITSVIGKSLKSRVLLYAASPLYNGNSEFYSDFKNPDGTHLISQTYDAGKWQRAKVAAQEAITAAENAGFSLYVSKVKTADNPFEQGVLNYRYAFVDKWNSETIWGFTFSGASNTNQRYMVPRRKNENGSNRPLGNIAPTFTAVQMYYTKNGLPLDVDPETKDLDLTQYSIADNTAQINLNREPRFYASIGYDGGEYEFGNISFKIKALAGQEQGLDPILEYSSASGYFCKKWVHPESSYDRVKNSFLGVRYPYPAIRLAELYLNFAEADFEANGSLSAEGKEYINRIRKRSGIPSLDESWSLVGGLPSGQKMRDLIQQERSIEMLMECTRFFDVRRWKIAHIVLNKPMYSWNIFGATTEEFYKLVIMEESGKRHFTSPRNYLHPIQIEDVNINENLVQNPGW